MRSEHGDDYAYVHEGRVVLVGDRSGGGAVGVVEGAVARGGHDDRRGESQPERAQAEQEGHRLGAIGRRRGRHHVALGSVHDDARTISLALRMMMSDQNHLGLIGIYYIVIYIQGNDMYI